MAPPPTHTKGESNQPASSPRERDEMTASPETFAIVGAGLAGAKAAETLREEGFDGRLVLIGDESERPYERPPLSKDYLRGEAEAKPYVHDQAFYEENSIELLCSTRVTGLDAGLQELMLEGDRRLGYDRLLLATGAVPRRLDIPGGDLDGIHYLRTLADSERIGAGLEAGKRLAVVGSGWIGAEIAASARQKGCEVTLLERGLLPLERVLGREIGQTYLDLHRSHGVEFLPETTVDRFEGGRTVQRVITSDGAKVEADFVVVGIGVAPRTGLVEAAGLRIDNGVVVDEYLQASAPGVYAAGDVANARHPFYGRHLRVEHWDTALHQGPVAARNMLGGAEPYARIPYFFSDQYETGMEYSGHATEWDEVVFRGDPGAHEFIAFWLKDERLVAGMNMNVWDVADPIRELIGSRRRLDPSELADPDIPLAELLEPGGADDDAEQHALSTWASEGGSF
jgi:3-phenylpropionate/trans-cinnamate dioxygenase ferredoxin reductase component